MPKWENDPELTPEEVKSTSQPRWMSGTELTDEELASIPKPQVPSKTAPPVEKKPETILEKMGNIYRGSAETAAALGTGAIAAPLAGWAGLLSAIPEGLGLADPGTASNIVEKVKGALTYEPRGEYGKQGVEAAGNIASLGGLLPKAAEALGEYALEKTGSPAAATAAHMVPDLVAQGLGTWALKPLKINKGLSPEQALKSKMLQEAVPEGFVVSPRYGAKSSLKARMMEDFGGRAQTAVEGSIRNSAAATRLAKQDLGIPQDKAITPEVLEGIRKTEGESYERIKSLPVDLRVNPKFKSTIDNLAGDVYQASKEFPQLVKNTQLEELMQALDVESMSPTAAVELTRKLRQQAKANQRAFDKPEQIELGRAQIKASDAIEQLIEDNLSSTTYRFNTIKQSRKSGQKYQDVRPLLEDFRNSRRAIARTYSVEDAIDPHGNIILRELAKQSNKGVPLSGGLKKSADFARSFERMTQPITVTGEHMPTFSPLGTYGAIIAGASSPHMAIAAGALPFIRMAGTRGALSNATQRALARPQHKIPYAGFYGSHDDESAE